MVMDFDGFYINKTFYPREFGYSSITTDLNESYRFKLNHLTGSLTDADWKTIIYCTRNIHGLSFRLLPWEKDFHLLKNLNWLILNAYNRNKTKENIFVAYKGGKEEQKKLDELKIPNVNLEEYGCPKYNALPPPNVEDCGYHIGDIISVHCPKKECYAFAQWIKYKLSNC